MIYIENFQFPKEDRIVYPYGLLSKKGLEHIEFAPITILYGNNGSGKSTILNVIAERLDIRNRSLGNTNEYFSGYVRKCTYTMEGDGIPEDSMVIRSEDIMHYIANIRKRNEDIDKVVKGWLMKGVDKRIRGSLDAEREVKRQFETLYDVGGRNSSFHAVMVNKLAEKTDEESNGETAISYFKDRLFPDNLYLLDEPENSMAPAFQQELADFICLLAYRLNCQFIIASHSPFMLSMQGARIYDLDHNPVWQREWFELDNMKAYYQLFNKSSKWFENDSRGAYEEKNGK